MTDTQVTVRLEPNPEDWTDFAGAGEIIRRSRPTIYDLVDRGILTRYQIGAHAMFWVAECREVARAMERLSRG